MNTAPDVRIIDGTDPETTDRDFLPGLGKTWLTPFFDISVRLFGMRGRYARTVELAGIRDGETVLDVGCGTGGLLLAALDAAPGARVTGLDPDVRALELAARKLRRSRRKGTLVRGFADRLPADDGTVDHVISSMALHHVPDAERPAFAREVARVLRPGGKVTILDVGGGGPADGGHGHSGGGRHAGGHSHGGGLAHLWAYLTAPFRRRAEFASGNLDDGILRLLTAAGLADAREIAHEDWSMGRLTYVQATAR